MPACPIDPIWERILKEKAGQETAYSVIESAAVRNSGMAGKKLARLMKKNNDETDEMIVLSKKNVL